jgi:hypothetical protein
MHGRFLNGVANPMPYEIMAGFNREKTPMYDRTTAYPIDKQGGVRQVFPILIHHRASWPAILNDIDRLKLAQ